MATAVIARRTGMFRCSGVGKTKRVRAGEKLPSHTSCKGGCEWEFRPEDNPQPEKVTIIIGDGPFFIIVMDEVPQVGDMLNLRSGLVGQHRVTKVGKITSKKAIRDMGRPRIMVERVGGYEEGSLIYAVGEVFL